MKKLTVKQAKFVKAKAEGKTGVQAAMEAYDTTDYNTASTIAVENMQKPTIQQAMAIAMEKQGINIDQLAEKLEDGLSAMGHVKVKTEHSVGSGKNKIVDIKEELVTFPDLDTRHKYLETTLRLTGLGKDSKVEGTTINQFGNIVNEMKEKYSE